MALSSEIASSESSNTPAITHVTPAQLADEDTSQTAPVTAELAEWENEGFHDSPVLAWGSYENPPQLDETPPPYPYRHWPTAPYHTVNRQRYQRWREQGRSPPWSPTPSETDNEDAEISYEERSKKAQDAIRRGLPIPDNFYDD